MSDQNYTPLAIEEKPKHAGGRPTVMTDEVVAKLRSSFLMGCTIGEACLNANISRDSYYDYIKYNPEFSDKTKEWRLNPILKARYTVFKNLDDKETAKWYLERKLKNEFAPRQEITGENGEPFILQVHSSLKYESKESQVIEADIVPEPSIDGNESTPILPAHKEDI